MQLEKTAILLEKINNLHKSLLKDADNISSIEKDLLKDYVKALYEALIDAPQKASKPKIIQRVVRKVQPVVVEPSGDQPSSSDIVEETPIAAAPEKKEYKPPRIIELPKEVKEELASTPPTEAQEVRHEAPAPQMDDDLAELFEEDGNNNDLSGRLANSPIKDLTRAISINEKIFTVNELFGGNMVDMEQTLKTLNNCSGFANATATILMEKAQEYKWTDAKRVKKAKNFIKLVRRRYL
jgi:hypothetical protein